MRDTMQVAYYMWDEVSGEIYSGEIPADLLDKDPQELIALLATRITDSTGDGDYDSREISQVGETTAMRGRYSHNLAFGLYIGNGAEELAHAEFDAFALAR